jgi:hypothetical protein
VAFPDTPTLHQHPSAVLNLKAGDASTPTTPEFFSVTQAHRKDTSLQKTFSPSSAHNSIGWVFEREKVTGNELV